MTPSTSSGERPATSKSNSDNNLRPVSHKAVQHHKVQPGEDMISIANTHHTTVEALKRDNGNPALLRPGMVLVIRPAQ